MRVRGTSGGGFPKSLGTQCFQATLPLSHHSNGNCTDVAGSRKPVPPKEKQRARWLNKGRESFMGPLNQPEGRNTAFLQAWGLRCHAIMLVMEVTQEHSSSEPSDVTNLPGNANSQVPKAYGPRLGERVVSETTVAFVVSQKYFWFMYSIHVFVHYIYA